MAKQETDSRRDSGAPSAPQALPPERQLRLGTLILIRWVAIAGQAATILVVHVGLDFTLPFLASLVAVGTSALLNLVLSVWRPATARLGDRAAAWLLAYDIAQLAVLLYLTGGLENPFALLLLAPVTVSATVLSRRSTIALCAFSLVCIALLAVWHVPLPWSSGGFQLPAIYVLGKWISLVMGIIFFASYTFRVAAEARRMSNALSALQLALAREQQISALGALAAAAAHELGSPLGTIAVTARELAHAVPDDSPLREDIDLMISETARCRDILAELARSPTGDDGALYTRAPLDVLLEMIAAPHLTDRVALAVARDPEIAESAGPIPQALRSPEIDHGLGNFIQNAVQFARSRVDVVIGWNDTSVWLAVTDDGPGFPPRLVERLGEPYLSYRETEGQHMGLGIFIAKTLLERTGATVRFGNRPEGGARVSVTWPRVVIDQSAL